MSFLISLLLLYSAPVFALPGSMQKNWPHTAPLELVATVSLADFIEGRQWHWNYFDSRGQNYSSEQYTVIENNNGMVLLEMASHFPGETVFKPHHRILVPVENCLHSYLSPSEKKTWSIRMFYLEGAVWRETEPPSTLAFEEKFNCNPYKHDSREFLTVFRSSPAGEIFAQQRWRVVESSWFMNEGADCAVVFEKKFPHGAGGETYWMRFETLYVQSSVSRP